ncbi:TolC family protein [bacterium]|nr:TolC family protein [bacterium]
MRVRGVPTAALWLLCVFLAAAGRLGAQAARPSLTLGVLQDGPWAGNDRVLELLQSEAQSLLGRDWEVRFPADKIIQADWSAASIRSGLDRLLADPSVDMVITAGFLSSYAACHLDNQGFAKPVIAPFAADAEGLGFPRSGQGSGVRNLHYLTFRRDLQRDLEVFHELAGFKRLTVVMGQEIAGAFPEVCSRLELRLDSLGYAHRFVLAGAMAGSVLDSLSGQDEAVYLGPTLLMDDAQFGALAQGLARRGIPSFSMLGRGDVERGILASLAPAFDLQRLARRVALDIQSIRLGQAPESLSVDFTKGEDLAINMATARATEVKPDWEIRTEATLIDDEPLTSRAIDLAGAVREAVERNLDLQARSREVLAGAQEVNRARANLLPDLELSGQGLVIDADRAQASFGLQPERTVTGSLELTQVLYSDKAWGNLEIQKRLQEARELDRESLRLDITREAASAYLNILRARVLERIRRNNLKVSRENLDLARMRVQIGYAGPGELYRWQAQIAMDKRAVIEAEWKVRLAASELNRLLQRPLEEPLAPREAPLDSPDLPTGDPRLAAYIGNAEDYALLREFMVREALAVSPELQRLDKAIAAQERARKMTSRSFWSPSVGLQAGYSERFAKSGAGAEGFKLDLPPSLPFQIELPTMNDHSWNVGLGFSLPLFNGGGNLAEHSLAGRRLEELRLTRQAAAQRIEQRLRAAMFQAGASWPGIRLSAQAAEAAHRNLALVTDAYGQGLLSITELLEAQSYDLTASQAAENAVYDFQFDLLALERAVGRFWMFRTDSEKEDLFRRLREYAAQAGSAGPVNP